MASLDKILAPGVHVIEVENPELKTDSFDGVDITVGACVGCFKKGKIGKPLLVTRNNFESIVGGPIQNAYGYYSLKGYFDNGASKAYVVRTAHYTDPSDPTTLTAVTAGATINDRGTGNAAQETIGIKASSEGTWGNNIAVVVYDKPIVSTTVSTAAASGASEIELTSLKNIEVGMMLKIGNEYFAVTDINKNTNKVTINGTLGSQVALNAVVTSNEFSLAVYDGSTLVELHEGLDIREASDHYFETAINENSSYIEVEDLASDATYPTNMPKSSESIKYFLTGGVDGLANIEYTDFIGNESAGTGIYAMKQTREAFRIWVPESSESNIGVALEKFCENYMYAFCVTTIPENYDVESAIQYKDRFGFDSSFSALSYGWGYVYDPIGYGKNPKKLVPLSGHFIGMWARMNDENDISFIPAGEEAILYGVTSLSYQLSDDEIAELNNAGIDSIIYINGLGIVNWGARTTSSDKRWRYLNARSIFEYVEKSIQEGTRWAVFQPTNESTWNRLTLACKTFLNSVPGLSGGTADERYSFVCDESNNPVEVREEGKIISDVGLNIEGIGEFVLFRIGHKKSDTTIEE